MTSNEIYPTSEQVHYYYLRSNALAKRVRLLALGLESLAGCVILVGYAYDFGSGWRPLIVLLLTGAGLLVRQYADAVLVYAQRCRRMSIRAFGRGQDVSLAVAHGLLSDAPLFTGTCLGKPSGATTLKDYYDPTTPPGEKRLRELYAHSAFFTSRLLHIYIWCLASVAVIIFLIGFVAIYRLALYAEYAGSSRTTVLDAVCSVLFIVFAMRALETMVKCARGYRSMHDISTALLRVPLLKGDALVELTNDYDLTRAEHPEVPTSLYMLVRGHLKTKWELRRHHLHADLSSDVGPN